MAQKQQNQRGISGLEGLTSAVQQVKTKVTAPKYQDVRFKGSNLLLPYVITIHEKDTQVKIYGPFRTETDAIEFGDEWQAKNDDSPFWNMIYHDGSPIVVQSPEIQGSVRFAPKGQNGRTTEQFEFEFVSTLS